MAHFRATIQGCRGEASRLGSKTSGISTTTNGWDLGISVEGRYDDKTDEDVFTVYLTSGSNGGKSKFLGNYTRAQLKEIEECSI